jgi:predicted nucleic acid-binding protein
MTVINTSPAIHLHAVLPGGLGSLVRLIGEVIVPWEVGQELSAGSAKDATWREIQALSGIHHRSAGIAVHPLLSAQIDLGEAAVIQTALDGAHDAVILDDLKARRIARTLGLQVTGTLGVLLQAKQSGLLPSVRGAITSLERRGMWIAPSLAAKAIVLAGE